MERNFCLSVKIEFTVRSYIVTTNVLAANRQLSELRQYYLSLTNMGLSTEEAEERCRERISPHGINVSGHNFIPIVLVGCAIRDLKIMPIESYQTKGADIYLPIITLKYYTRN